ncbi:MAG: Cytochrome C553 (soluble cytochrome f) [uncultured Campylobacterales bacterium]|uniref:Cytochrome C553 (Soluble cytochrome f) n=1 Tax=uncultured Campylobacterales bacterium TaxID=352960 RepID=A0A6S6SM51_9BACT|nr:MAG: Cytochrome C553 (soluble cytochrome f) [uncultured Campylobacterales bacterium]
MKKILITILVLSSCVFASADLYKRCIACHGVNGEKKAMNASPVIQGYDENKTISTLKGYKDGTYGGKMKMLMKGQVASLSDEDIKSLASYIKTLK